MRRRREGRCSIWSPLPRVPGKQGVRCEVVVRPGLPADQILTYTRDRAIDRIAMGTHSPGPIGKLLVGSVAEAVLRTSTVPVFIVGPDVLDGSTRDFATRTILCAASLRDSSVVAARFAADLAMQHGARLILQHVIRPQERHQILAGRSVDQIEGDLLELVPANLQSKIELQAIVVPGDPTEELLLPGPGPAGRPHRAGRAWCVRLCRHHAARGGLQSTGTLAMPGADAFTGGAGSRRRYRREGVTDGKLPGGSVLRAGSWEYEVGIGKTGTRTGQRGN